MTRRVAIVGGSGLLGLNWALRMRDQCDIHLLLNKRDITLDRVTKYYADFSSASALQKLVQEIDPHILINAAALTDVDKCQSAVSVARRVNVNLACDLAIIASNLACKLIHISTDQLFDGKSGPYGESDKVNPMNHYGFTKCMAENLILQNNNQALILRTNFFGWGSPYRRSFSDWIIDALKSNETLEMYADNLFTPVYVGRLIAVAHALADLSKSGIYNVASNRTISKYDFALMICNTFSLNHNLVLESSLRSVLECDQSKAPRPLRMDLSNEKIRSTLCDVDFDLDEMLSEFSQDWQIERILAGV